MFCYQCEQCAAGRGCTVRGVCGKTAETADLQDLLIEVLRGVAQAASEGESTAEADALVIDGLFTTVTNVNFDAEDVNCWIEKALKVRDKLVSRNGLQFRNGPITMTVPQTMEERIVLAADLTPQARAQQRGDVIQGLYDLVLLGLKGTAAYAHHAAVLGVTDPEVYRFFHRVLGAIGRDGLTADELLGLSLEVGQWNLRVMELLDRANTSTYGTPEPTSVKVTAVAGKAILVSGHDLRDLHELLEQTDGKGINVYTHGEMLPCLAYPELKKFPHLVGNYGGAWQDQVKEFAAFPGAVLMTTNCIQKPAESYRGRIFTSGLVQYPGVTHISDRNFSPVIEAALAAPGFECDKPEQRITIGFGHGAVLSVAPAVIDAVKSGAIRHFFLVGGCDGAKSGRNYYTELASQIPSDCVILTLACGKFRFNKMEFGDIGGISRLLDMGQCNDAYSAIRVAVALAEAFGCGVNDLPLSLILSWYEQKAVCILLTLLFLGIKNIRLGPSLPAFIKPEVLAILQEKFSIMPIGTAEGDLSAILG